MSVNKCVNYGETLKLKALQWRLSPIMMVLRGLTLALVAATAAGFAGPARWRVARHPAARTAPAKNVPRLGAGGSNEDPPPSEPSSSWLDGLGDDEELKEDVRVYVQTLAICLLIRFLLVEPRFIPSLSMYPAFDVGDQLAVEKVTKVTRPLALAGARSFERNEVVVFHPPPAFQEMVDRKSGKEALIKRIVAVAGDAVEVKDRTLYVNGVAQDEAFENEKPNYAMAERTVPPGNVFVLGDNRNQSLDGHIWGFLPTENIIGRAVFKYWPPASFGAVPFPTPNY